ncbi:hypothetical protein GCM10022210_27510 [Mucilaginibacter dorajii]|uniref:Uncharacterized protein n=1 Tax=Mucilaginibacter dorajii TaxID=692994 RepID=A0ABP7Q329_9SPHI
MGVCTAIYATIGIKFVNSKGAGVVVTNFTAKNLRSDSLIVAVGVIDPGFSPSYRTIATDGNKAQFSMEGDNVQISATNPDTHQIKTTTMKIAGGCTCHINKVSGPDTVTFD